MKPFKSPKWRSPYLSILLVLLFLLTQSSFVTALNTNKKNLWSNWDPIEEEKLDAPEYNALSIKPLPSGAQIPLDSNNRYIVTPKENPLTVALKASDMISSLSAPLDNLSAHRSIVPSPGLPKKMMLKADALSEQGGQMYQGLRDMFTQVDGMKKQLARNYESFNQSSKNIEDSKKHNQLSDQMADRLVLMQQSFEGIKEHAQINRDILKGMMDSLSEIGINGQESKNYYNKLTAHTKDISSRFEQMAKQLEQHHLEAPGAFNDVRNYLSSFQNYVQEYKKYNADEDLYVINVKNYIQRNSVYLDKAVQNLGETDVYLKQMEQYFRSAKVKSEDPLTSPNQETSDICATLTDAPDQGPLDTTAKKGKPLQSLENCQKDCRNVCRQKKKIGDTQCYECPSGSPDTCHDVGGLPADTSWCKAGGICYDDPMLYCSPYAATGPNLMKLQCQACLERPDECAAIVDPETSTYTNCIKTCPDGDCVYKGKYPKPEWDGKNENVHCFKCERPAPPPSCEDLGWGSTKEDACLKDCKDGVCKQATITIGPDGKPHIQDPNASPVPAPPAGGNNAPAGQGQGERQGGSADQPGGSGTHAQPVPNPADGGKNPNPPTGNPQDGSTGGGGSVAGATSDKDSSGVNQPSSNDPTKPQHPPEAPSGGTPPTAPTQPGSSDKPQEPQEPKIEPPSTPDIDFYKKWLAETKERLKTREDILADPNEGEYVKSAAQHQKEGMTRTKEYLENRINTLEQEEIDRRNKEQEALKRREEWERTRPKTIDYAAEAERRGQQWRLNNLKTATTNLRDIAQEAKDVLEGRVNRLEKTAAEIRRLENENKYFSNPEYKDNIDQTVAKETIKRNQERLNDLRRMQTEFNKKFQEAQRSYEQAIEKAKSEYRKALWQVDENARRKAEVERIDEYFELSSDLHRREQTRTLRTQTFDQIAADLENARKTAENKNDTTEVRKLTRQIDNLRREQATWTETQIRLEENIKNQMFETGLRNFMEGAGPSRDENLIEKLIEYEGLLSKRLSDPALNSEQKAALKATLEGIKDKKQALTNPQLDNETRTSVIQSTTRVANAAVSTDPDKSFLRLAAESLAEETVHNMNPLVMAKKNLAFGWGIVQGVGTAVKGVAEIGVGATKLLVQSSAVNLGFEDGGIFGTDAIDTLSGVLTTIGDNTNPNGLLKAVLAAGGAIDAKIKELERSGDIDWATAEFGGKFVGENIVAPELMAVAAGAALSKAKTLIRGTEAATEIASTAVAVERTTQRAVNATSKIDDAAVIGGKIEQAGKTGANTLDDIARTKNTPKPTEAPVTPETKTLPKSETPATTQPRAPPAPAEPVIPLKPNETPYKGVGSHEEISFINDRGEKVVIKTGDQLGKGSTSTAFADAGNPNKVVRVTEIGAEGSPEVIALDKFGREAVETIQRPNGPIRIVEKGERYVIPDPANPAKGKVIEVVERVQNGSADKFLPKQGGSMTKGQAEAFDLATRELNKNGYAWMDNHTGNYGFEKIPGTDDKWRVVVIDSGGIVPAKGATLAEKAENASLIQQRINVPSEEYLDGYEMTKRIQNDRIKKGIADDARHAIVDEVGSKIDTTRMGLTKDAPITRAGLQDDFPNGDEIFDWLNSKNVISQTDSTAKDISQAIKDGLYEAFPDQADDILRTLRKSKAVSDVAFYPGGTLEFKEIQQLSKMSLEDALAYHANK